MSLETHHALFNQLSTQFYYPLHSSWRTSSSIAQYLQLALFLFRCSTLAVEVGVFLTFSHAYFYDALFLLFVYVLQRALVCLICLCVSRRIQLHVMHVPNAHCNSMLWLMQFVRALPVRVFLFCLISLFLFLFTGRRKQVIDWCVGCVMSLALPRFELCVLCTSFNCDL